MSGRGGVQFLQDVGVRLSGLCSLGYEENLFRLAFSLAFFWELRLGELVSPSARRAGGLLNENMDFYAGRVEVK